MTLPVCSADPIADAGHGVTYEVRRLDGIIEGVAYWHPRPDGQGQCQGYFAFRPKWTEGHDLVQESPLTVSPSLLCRACNHHGFLRDGRWVPA
jgi:hypothetical protein